MIAILRYAYLKSLRDRSLFAFVIFPILFPVAALIGVTLGQGHLRYPFYMNVHYSPVQNATLCAQIALMICVFFTLIPAFWTLRPEIATRSVASFFFAARPITVALSVILFAFALGVAGWIGAVAMIGTLTAALPPHLAFMTLKLAAGTLATSAIGVLLVTVSSSPAVVVGGYMACALLIQWIVSAKSFLDVLAFIGVAIVSAALAGFLLERRCAT